MNQTSLFHADLMPSRQNLLPKDGVTHYYPEFISNHNSAKLMTQLLESLPWEEDRLLMFGRVVTTRRKVVWIGDPKCDYTYSGIKRQAQRWTAELLLVKGQLEDLTKSKFNSCLLNLYHDGNDGMGWHSDDEKELDAKSPIASLSLGATRKFAFRHKKDKTTHSILLENGSALIMHAPTQEYWQHALQKTKKIDEPRINLTFRSITPNDR
ncbi:alpha-ketoglutarate-dependent dioxygenase AlkB [Polynucleobacter sp. Latsch14-2]|uniref:alpha-ketoglutarate-dependent dioxygenase AlkB family protein n=1 Tax=Polynucleobacter sp. Latsch14-2 TaxID=2576920 RepID=UPI001C0CAC45|nr:alpha-ketoglutarate-dependent dioxygenase AlkB [Polynucleobacter sp. Latsch14-2]MBU3613671.1 alpha-ketoglutarate-dependent dioxygenase AlkB [Polynucleobacter sp. Latsch14-2]